MLFESTLLVSIGAATVVAFAPVLSRSAVADAASHAAGMALFGDGPTQVNGKPAGLILTQTSVPFQFRVGHWRVLSGDVRYLLWAIQNFSGAQAASAVVSVRGVSPSEGLPVVRGEGGLRRGPGGAGGLPGLGDFVNG